MMNISAIASSILLFFIFAASFIMQIGKADPKELNLSMEEDQKFYEKIVVPMMRKCTAASNHFGIDDKGKEKSEAKLFCEKVKEIENYLVKLDGEQAKEGISDQIGNLSTQIHSVVDSDRKQLEKKYIRLLQIPEPNDLANEIRRKIIKIGKGNDGKNWIPAFKKSYEEFKKEVVGKQVNRCETKECQKTVYELLYIGRHMLLLSVQWNDEEKRALAYKQFAINLTIHSLHFANLPKSANGKGILEGIQKIVASWMENEGWLSNLHGISAQFYTVIIVPLVKICDWHFGFYIADQFTGYKGGEILCGTVKQFGDILFKLDGNGIYKAAKNGKKNLAQEVDNLTQIYDRIMQDAKYSKQLCYKSFSEKISKQIDEEISNISKTPADLNEAFKDTFNRLIEALEKEEKANREEKISDYWNISFAYKLLSIGEKMEHLYITSIEEKMHWAYKQFAADLALYSLRLSLPAEYGDGNKIGEEIRKIAQNLMQIMLGEEVKTKTNAHSVIGGKGGDH